ncbi:hypothetical protein AYK25_09275 [Thermoplasmatales archaeon SM1-50]|nr:MAG: hypothetical protein AYK25_09275 [Thermoplasmatales archaeon SM1-50]
MKIRYRLLGLLFVIICLFLMNLVPVVQATTDYFTDSVILVVGKSNTVSSTLLWLLGMKCIFNRRVIIQVHHGEGEKIFALILPPKIGFYFGHENIVIQIFGAKGLLFWGEKSLIFENDPPHIFALCKARDIWVTYD